MVPTKVEQIESLLTGTACELVERYVPPEELSGNSYSEIFSVTRNEIRTYVMERRELSDLVNTHPGNLDGFYAIAERGGFHVYEQERQIKFMEELLATERAVLERYIDYVIRRSGTGLDFEH